MANSFLSIYNSFKDRIEQPALLRLLADMKQRIHNKGLDSSGNLIAGKYSKGWERVRRGERKYRNEDGDYVFIESPRQVGYVDLQFLGDLFKDFQNGKVNNDNVLGMESSLSFDKAGWMEETYEKGIYYPTAEELDTVDQAIDGEIDFVINKYLEDV